MNTTKKIFATAMLVGGFLLSANAQQVDGRDFSIDGFAACTGKPGTNYYLAEGTTGGAAGKVVYAKNFSQLQAYLQAKYRIQRQDIACEFCMEILQIEALKLLPDFWQKPQSRKSPDPAAPPGGHRHVHFSLESNRQQDWRGCLYNAFPLDA